MAHIMEFLINLLLMKGKFLKETAVETLHEAILKWLQFKRRLSFDYQKTSSMAGSFDNMWEMVNFHAGEYTTEENYVVNKNFHTRLRDQLKKIRRHEGLNYYDLWEPDAKPHRYLRNESPAQICQRSVTFKKHGSDDKQEDVRFKANLKRHQHYVDDKSVNKKKPPCMNDYLIDNLRAILKTQELLFKNITKLITILEKDHRVNDDKLENLKNKLNACTEILSGVRPVFPESIINDIIEEEITRCRFRNGLTSTSADIDLRKRKPVGLEIVIEPDRPPPKNPRSNKPQTIAKNNDPKIVFNRQNESLQRANLNAEVVKDAAKFVDHYSKPLLMKSSNEMLRFSQVNAEAIAGSKHFLDHYPKTFRINRRYEKLRRSQINLEAGVDAKNFAKTLRISRSDETVTESKSFQKYSTKKMCSNRLNETLRRSEVHTEVANDAKKFIDRFSKTIQIERGNEVFRQENIDLEITRSSYQPHRCCSMPIIKTESIRLSRKHSDIDLRESRKLIEINTEHFYQFENSLHQLKTTMKFKSLKEDHVNMRKMAFLNKRQFLRIENSIMKKLELDRDRDNIAKMLLVNDIMFQIMERKLLFGQEEMQKFEEELEKEIKIMQLIDAETQLLHMNSEAFRKYERKNDMEKRKSGTASTSNSNEKFIVSSGLGAPLNVKRKSKIIISDKEQSEKDVAAAEKLKKIIAQPEGKEMIMNELQKIQKIITEPDQIAHIISLENIAKVELPELKPKKSKETAQSQSKMLVAIEPKKVELAEIKAVSENNVAVSKLQEKIELEALKKAVSEPLKILEKASQKTVGVIELNLDFDKKQHQIMIIEPEQTKQLITVNEDDQKKSVLMIQQDKNDKVAIIVAEKPSQLMTVPVAEKRSVEKPQLNLVSAETERRLVQVLKSVEKLAELEEDGNVTEHKVSELQRKNEAEVQQVNAKAFDEMETTLKTLTIFMEHSPSLTRSNSGFNPPSDKHKRPFDDPLKKNMSTIIPFVPDKKAKPSSDSRLVLTKKIQEAAGRSGYQREKTKTFMKSASEVTCKNKQPRGFTVKNQRQIIPKMKTAQVKEVPVIGKEMQLTKSHSLLQMRRTTKTAMKKQQVLTIAPKIEKEAIKRKPKIVSNIAPDQIKTVQTDSVAEPVSKDASTNTPKGHAAKPKNNKGAISDGQSLIKQILSPFSNR